MEIVLIEDKGDRPFFLYIKSAQATFGYFLGRTSFVNLLPIPLYPMISGTLLIELFKAGMFMQSLKTDSGINPDITEVRKQPGNKPDNGKKIERSKDNRIITVQYRVVAQQPHAVQRKNCLNQQTAREKCSDKRAGKTGDNRDDCVTKYMFIQYLPVRQSLGPGSHHILFADLFKKGILGQQGHNRQAAHC